MRYVDGYLLAVHKDKVDDYKKISQEASEFWMKHGALMYVETVQDDLQEGNEWCKFPFPEAARAKEDEVVIFSFIIFKSKEHRDEVNANVMKDMDEEKEKFKEMSMPFELGRMAYGGFRAIVDESAL